MSELTAAEWNERYPAGTPVRYRDGRVMVTVGTAWFDPTRDGNSAAVKVSSGNVLLLVEVEPLATDTDRLAAGWLDPTGVEIVWAERDKAIRELKKAKLRVGEHDEPCPHDHPGGSYQSPKCVKPRGHGTHWNGAGDAWTSDTDAWLKLTAERDKAIRERDSLARRLALRFEGTEKLRAERDEARAAIDPANPPDDDLWRVAADEWLYRRAKLTAERDQVIRERDVARASLNEQSEVMADEVIYAHALLAAQGPVIEAARTYVANVRAWGRRQHVLGGEAELVVAVDALDAHHPHSTAVVRIRIDGRYHLPGPEGVWVVSGLSTDGDKADLHLVAERGGAS